MLDLTNKVFGKLTVIRRGETHITPNGSKKIKWECLCSCGSIVFVRGESLRNKTTLSCGCYRLEEAKQRPSYHGGVGTPEYETWRGMQSRCTYIKDTHYKLYGGRGITVCSRWNSFRFFLKDMGKRPEGCSLERKDNNLGYYKENCKWATSKEQSRNTTRSIKIEFNGISLNQCDWAEKIGITPEALANRLKTMELSKALTLPKLNKGGIRK